MESRFSFIKARASNLFAYKESHRSQVRVLPDFVRSAVGQRDGKGALSSVLCGVLAVVANLSHKQKVEGANPSPAIFKAYTVITMIRETIKTMRLVFPAEP